MKIQENDFRYVVASKGGVDLQKSYGSERTKYFVTENYHRRIGKYQKYDVLAGTVVTLEENLARSLVNEFERQREKILRKQIKRSVVVLRNLGADYFRDNHGQEISASDVETLADLLYQAHKDDFGYEITAIPEEDVDCISVSSFPEVKDILMDIFPKTRSCIINFNFPVLLEFAHYYDLLTPAGAQVKISPTNERAQENGKPIFTLDLNLPSTTLRFCSNVEVDYNGKKAVALYPIPSPLKEVCDRLEREIGFKATPVPYRKDSCYRMEQKERLFQQHERIVGLDIGQFRVGPKVQVMVVDAGMPFLDEKLVSANLVPALICKPEPEISSYHFLLRDASHLNFKNIFNQLRSSLDSLLEVVS